MDRIKILCIKGEHCQASRYFEFDIDVLDVFVKLLLGYAHCLKPPPTTAVLCCNEFSSIVILVPCKTLPDLFV